MTALDSHPQSIRIVLTETLHICSIISIMRQSTEWPTHDTDNYKVKASPTCICDTNAIASPLSLYTILDLVPLASSLQALVFSSF